MPSLKEVKSRISSVQTTRKITQARQMVASARLHRAQGALEQARAYRDGLTALAGKLAGEPSPLRQAHTAGDVGLVAFSSNSGMCGSFNSRVEKELRRIVDSRRKERFVFYPVGAKIREALQKGGYAVAGDFDALADDKAAHTDLTALCAGLVEGFVAERFKSVELLYFNFQSKAAQALTSEVLLPLSPPVEDLPMDQYIIEPSLEELNENLLRMLVAARLYAALLSGRASEHAARMLAMQLATDNADDLLDDLKLSYNKIRQQNITSELLDIIGSSFA